MSINKLAFDNEDFDLETGNKSSPLTKAAKERIWREENKAAIEACNDYVEKHGPSLARLRLF